MGATANCPALLYFRCSELQKIVCILIRYCSMSKRIAKKQHHNHLRPQGLSRPHISALIFVLVKATPFHHPIPAPPSPFPSPFSFLFQPRLHSHERDIVPLRSLYSNLTSSSSTPATHSGDVLDTHILAVHRCRPAGAHPLLSRRGPVSCP